MRCGACTSWRSPRCAARCIMPSTSSQLSPICSATAAMGVSRSQSTTTASNSAREPRAAFAPRRRHLLDLVPLTLHPRHLGSQNRAVLAGIQVPASAADDCRSAAPAARTPGSPAPHRRAPRIRSPRPAPTQLDVCDSPGRLDVQSRRVHVLVTHGSSVALLPGRRAPPLHPRETRKTLVTQRQPRELSINEVS